jgi:predicted ribosome quality control (RQC) complex YloA/Tae2 family protein
LNYFNYFTEIEEAFIRRRGKHLLLSPMDWALIESWKEMGVPLFVALRGIERAFDSHEAKPRRRSVKTLLYCQEEVEAQFAEWQDSQLGAGPEIEESAQGRAGPPLAATPDDDAPLPFARASILAHLANARGALGQLRITEEAHPRANGFGDTLARVGARLLDLENDFARAARPDAERLEDSLSALEKMLDESLRESVPATELKEARAEAEGQLQPYRARMEKATYEQTLENLLLKRLRESRGVPRLSLFYL